MTSDRREPGGSDELRDRIIQLGNDLWSGNRTRMAADLDQSQSSITRVMTRQQAPSGRLIENLARNRAINLEWLFRGDGEPWERPEPIAMPVFTSLLPCDPREADASPSDWLALAQPHFRPTRYWLRIQGNEPICGSPENITHGDLLLMETQRSSFPDRVVEQICGVQFEDQLKLAMVTYYDAHPDTGPARIEADPFDLDRRSEERVRQYVIHHRHGKQPTVTTQELVQSASGKPRHKTSDDLDPSLPHITADQIVSMCVLVLRQPSRYWKL